MAVFDMLEALNASEYGITHSSPPSPLHPRRPSSHNTARKSRGLKGDLRKSSSVSRAGAARRLDTGAAVMSSKADSSLFSACSSTGPVRPRSSGQIGCGFAMRQLNLPYFPLWHVALCVW